MDSAPEALFLAKRSVISYEDVDSGSPDESMTYQEHRGSRSQKGTRFAPRRATLQSSTLHEQSTQWDSIAIGYSNQSESESENNGSDDEGLESFQRAVLPVAARLSEESLGPQTGEEYLLTVRREAQSLPRVFLATSMPVKRPPSPSTLKVSAYHASSEPVRIMYAEDYLTYFLSLKNMLSELVELHGEPPVDSFREYGELDTFPRNLDAKAWYEWMYGKLEGDADHRSSVQPTDTNKSVTDAVLEDDNDDKAGQGTGEEANATPSQPPCLTAKATAQENRHPHYAARFQELAHHVQFLAFLLKFDQRIVLRLLKLHETWLKIADMTELQGQWIFNLLVRLNPLLTSNEISVLRDLCRKCLTIRQKLVKSPSQSPENQRTMSLDMIVCIITTYYGQRDLLLRRNIDKQ